MNTPSTRAGLTLLEVLIATAILSVAMGVVSQSLVTGTAASRSVEATNELGNRTTRGIQTIANKLRSCDYNLIYLGSTSWTGTSGGNTLCSFRICTDLDVAGPRYGQTYLVTYDPIAGTVVGTTQDVASGAILGTDTLATDVVPGGFSITDISGTSTAQDNRVRIDLECFVSDPVAPRVGPWAVGGRTITNAWTRRTSTVVFLRATLWVERKLTGGTTSVTGTGSSTSGGTTSGGGTSGGGTSGGTTTTPQPDTSAPVVDASVKLTVKNAGKKSETQTIAVNGSASMPSGSSSTIASFKVVGGPAVENLKTTPPGTGGSWSATASLNIASPASDRWIEITATGSNNVSTTERRAF